MRSLAMALQANLDEPQMEAYGEWVDLRSRIEDELMSIERALRNDPEQIGSSAETVYESADNLRHLVPELKQIAKAIEDLEHRQTLEALPR